MDEDETRRHSTPSSGDGAGEVDPRADDDAIHAQLLIHPDDEPDHASPHPFGAPGAPVSRRSPFYVGFMGGLGALTAIVLGLAIRQVGSALILILVAFFLAVGLNPLVEWLIRRGVRRQFAVAVVALGVLAVLVVFITALVPGLLDQIEALIQNVPTWLDDLRKNSTVQDFDNKYHIIDTVNEKIQSADFAQTAFGSVF